MVSKFGREYWPNNGQGTQTNDQSPEFPHSIVTWGLIGINLTGNGYNSELYTPQVQREKLVLD